MAFAVDKPFASAIRPFNCRTVRAVQPSFLVAPLLVAVGKFSRWSGNWYGGSPGSKSIMPGDCGLYENLSFEVIRAVGKAGTFDRPDNMVRDEPRAISSSHRFEAACLGVRAASCSIRSLR